MNLPENPVRERKCPDCEVALPTVTDIFLHGISAHKDKFDLLYSEAAKVPRGLQLPDDTPGWN